MPANRNLFSNPPPWPLHLEQLKTELVEDDHTIDLREIPGERWRLFPIHSQATLHEAQLTMEQNNGRAVYVNQESAPLMTEVAGIITQQDIESFYR